MGGISVYKGLMSYRWHVWFSWKKCDVHFREKGSGKKKIRKFPLLFKKNPKNKQTTLGWFFCLFAVFCLLAFILNFKVNIAWQHGDWLGFQVWVSAASDNYLTCILGGCCIYVNGIFKEKECFCIFTVFLWKTFHDCQFETGKIHVTSAYSVFLPSSSNFEPDGYIFRSQCYCL